MHTTRIPKRQYGDGERARRVRDFLAYVNGDAPIERDDANAESEKRVKPLPKLTLEDHFARLLNALRNGQVAVASSKLAATLQRLAHETGVVIADGALIVSSDLSGDALCVLSPALVRKSVTSTVVRKAVAL